MAINNLLLFARKMAAVALPRSAAARWATGFALPLIATLSFYTFGSASPANISPVELSADPLYSQGVGQKPTLTLALSVEQPTVGAQFRGDYTQTGVYPGYYDSDSCYEYKKDEALPRFDRKRAAVSHFCNGDGFSGHFLNWATSSSIDVLRLGLTGGDRIEDGSSITVLQRAVLPKSFWREIDNKYFPKKLISYAFAKNVLPREMLGNYRNNVYISNCLNHVFFSTAATNGSCDAPDYTKSLGAKKSGASAAVSGPYGNSAVLSNDLFYTRVQVCESSGGVLKDPRKTLCQKYPDGNYKPVGNMQKYSDRIRVSAFGYLTEYGNDRYGGVLRAPMKFVGSKNYDADGTLISGINSKREWNLDSGIFITNPESASENQSGVINYLNKFGRTGVQQGIYRNKDPVSELYYESLRYLQGLDPTPQAVSNMTATLKGGFPVYETWSDPFSGGSKDKNYACLKNNIFMIGDVNANYDKSIPGNTRTDEFDFRRTSEVSLSNNVPDFVHWTKVVGGFESNKPVSYIDGKGVTRTTSNPTETVNAARWGMENQDTSVNGVVNDYGASYYIAGMAYWAHTHDIRGSNWNQENKRRPGMRVTTYILDVNEQSEQDIDSNRYNSQFFLTAKYGGFSDRTGTGNPFLPDRDNSNWESQTQPNEAKTYFLAGNATAVLDALDNIFAATAAASTSIAAAPPSTNQLSTSDGYIYTAKFDPEYWSGDLRRSIIKLDADGEVVQLGSNIISAAAKLDALTTAQLANRKIYIGKSDRPATAAYAMEFKWASIESDASLKEQLNKATPTSTADGLGSSRVDFLRGNRSLEVASFRKRSSRLGDIVNSGPVYTAAPTSAYSTTAYNAFYSRNKNRINAIYVGANDGMLHAFDATTMKELFAYIPSWLGSKLSLLTTAFYNSSAHTSYVDATPFVAEADLGTATSPQWKTVLISGTGGGGQGVFALDVTDPSAFTASKVLWEFTDKDDADMGYVVGKPRLLKVRTSAPSATTPTYKWFGVVPSGVNNYENDGAFSEYGNPALFLLDLSKPTRDTWVLGTNYFKISLPVSSDSALGTKLSDGSMKATGLINFEAILGVDREVQHIYMGDLHGNFWKLDFSKADFSDSSVSSWNLKKISSFKNGSTPLPLYIAKDSSGKVQPISATPNLVYGPNKSIVIALGTGKYLEPMDNNIGNDAQTQSFYALYDNNESDPDTSINAKSFINGRGHLIKGSVSESGSISVDTFNWGRPLADSDTTRRAGWYIDFPRGGANGGERLVTSSKMLGKHIYFNTLLPPGASSNACGGGSSYSYSANLATGLGAVKASTTGLLGEPIVFNLSSSLTSSDSTGSRIKTDTKIVGSISPSTNKFVFTDPINTSSTVGRLSWRQINNYQDLKNRTSW